jgi:hypothetical protein
MIGLTRIRSDNRQPAKLQEISFNREFAHREKRGALYPSERSAVWPTDSCLQSDSSGKAWFIDFQTHFLGSEVAVPLSAPKVYRLRLRDWVCEAAVPVKAFFDAQREQPAGEQALAFSTASVICFVTSACSMIRRCQPLVVGLKMADRL